MRPDELLSYELVWDGAEFIQERAPLKVDVEAVPKTDLLFALKHIRVNSEGEPNSPTALLEAGHDLLPDLLAESESQKAVFNLLLLSLDFLPSILLSINFHHNESCINIFNNLTKYIRIKNT